MRLAWLTVGFFLLQHKSLVIGSRKVEYLMTIAKIYCALTIASSSQQVV